jgi:hypothetical protein
MLKNLEPREIPSLPEYDKWIARLFAARGKTFDGTLPYVVLFGPKYNVETILFGDDARAFHRGLSEEPSLKASPYIYYDPYDFPEWFYWCYEHPDLFNVLVFHGVILENQYERTILNTSWGDKF